VALTALSVAGQFALLYAVLSAPMIPGASSISAIAGLVFIACGGLLAVSGALDMSNNFKTGGVYSLCRHPIYAGLIIGCIGLDFFTASPERLFSRVLFTGGLCAVLWYQAEREELELEFKHGPAYREWADSVPRFFPSPMDLFLDARYRGSESTLGSLLSTGVVISILLACGMMATIGRY